MENLKTNTDEEILNFIRKTLEFESIINDSIRLNEPFDITKKPQHYRFDMSGYDGNIIGDCTVNNMNILNKFTKLGIYDYTHYLFLDFYQGTPSIYLKYWNSDQNLEIDNLAGYTTSEIILKIFKLTILTDKETRRR
jgi:hypothetical protein